MVNETEGRQQVPENVRTVDMAFADQHELDPNMDEDDYIDEPVKAVQVGPNLWRLEQNPMFTEMAAYKDTVEGDFNEYGVFVVQRMVGESGLRTIRTGVPKMFYFSDFGKAFLESVMEAGGMWEIVFWGILILNLPEGQADELEELFHAACKEAKILGNAERTPPNQLYRQRPEGGASQTEENN